MTRAKSAFTLIELLVVISIIAILAGLLLPVLNRVTESGRNAKCVGNLKQIGAAMFAFAAEHNGLLPESGAAVAYGAIDPTTNQKGWTQQLEPYLGTDRTVYICPSSSKVVPENVQYSYFQGVHAAWFAAGTQSPIPPNQFAPVRMSLFTNPSRNILSGDISASGMFQVTDDDKDDYTQNPAFAVSPAPFHYGHVNLLFGDGHVAGFAAFDAHFMTTHYDLQPDGTGYPYP